MGLQTIEATPWGSHTLRHFLLLGLFIVSTAQAAGVLNFVPQNREEIVPTLYCVSTNGWCRQTADADAATVCQKLNAITVPSGTTMVYQPPLLCKSTNPYGYSDMTIQGDMSCPLPIRYPSIGYVMDFWHYGRAVCVRNIPDVCPAKSTSNATQCACDVGYQSDVSGTQCVAACPAHASPTNDSSNSCTCDSGYEWDASHTQCVPAETYTLTLQSNKPSIEPSGTTAGDGNSSATFTVTVIDQSTQQGPTKPVQVKLIVHKPTEGGHDHDDPSRPRGRLNGTECTTDEPCVTLTFNDGIATQTVNYNAPIVSGKHSFSATCDKCGNSPQTVNLEVKVEGLKPIPDFPFYSLLETNGAVVGARTGWHTNNHNLTPEAAGVLMRIASNYYFNPKFLLRAPVTNTVSFPPLFHLNDASLPLGGVYDICARPNACESTGIVEWDAPHFEHRRGTVIDVRANGADGAIPSINRRKLENYLVEKRVSYKRESIGTSNEHFHIRLIGKKE